MSAETYLFPDTHVTRDTHVGQLSRDTHVSTQVSDRYLLKDTHLCHTVSHEAQLLRDTHVTQSQVTADSYLFQSIQSRESHVAQLLRDTHVTVQSSHDAQAPETYLLQVLRDTKVTSDAYVTCTQHEVQLLRDTHLTHVLEVRDTHLNDREVSRDERTIRDVSAIRARATDVSVSVESDEQTATFITLIKKGANFVLSANFAFWLVRTLFVPILHFRYLLVRKWNV